MSAKRLRLIGAGVKSESYMQQAFQPSAWFSVQLLLKPLHLRRIRLASWRAPTPDDSTDAG